MDEWERFDRLKLWRALELFFPSHEDREKWQITFYLNTTPVLFHQWLDHRVYYESVKTQPIAVLPAGEMFVNFVQVERNGIFKIWVHGTLVQKIQRRRGPDEKSYFKLGALIMYKAIIIAERRIEVQASCLTPYATSYFRTQLAQIGHAWPESDLEALFAKYRPRSPLLVRRSPNAERDEEIFKLHMEGKTRHELAKEYNLSTERIKQIVREQRDRRAG
jgi:hypothetical protein